MSELPWTCSPPSRLMAVTPGLRECRSAMQARTPITNSSPIAQCLSPAIISGSPRGAILHSASGLIGAILWPGQIRVKAASQPRAPMSSNAEHSMPQPAGVAISVRTRVDWTRISTAIRRRSLVYRGQANRMNSLSGARRYGSKPRAGRGRPCAKANIHHGVLIELHVPADCDHCRVH